MKQMVLYLLLAAGHLALVAVYYFLSSDAAGATMLLIFGVAMGVFLWSIVPTVGDVGPTAPVDPEWHERR